MKKFVACFLLLVSCFSSGGLAQERPKLFDAVEREFRQKEPRWKIERLDVQGDMIRKLDIVFRSGIGQAHVGVEIWDTVKNGRDVFAGRAIAEANTAGTRIKRALPGFGDEAYIWLNPRSDAWPSINFRKGVVNVSVFAPNVTTAKRFARRVLELIPES